MSSGVDVGRRPGIWSYLPFSGPRRRTSVSLPRNHSPRHDPFSRDGHSTSTGTPLSSSSPASTGLMNDFKGSAMNQGRQARYLKTGGIIALLILMVYFLAPKGFSHSPTAPGGNTASEGAGTEKCAKSYSRDKPLIQYALMIDAGSTGSRIHVYKFNNCGPTPELEGEEFAKTATKKGGSGLSIYPDDPEAAAKSLDVLLDVALKNVPKAYQSCTPIAVKATAGLRKIGQEKSDKILEAVRHRLETEYPFPVVSREQKGVEVMDGSNEGVFAWITTNYLLGKIGGPDKNPTAAVLDLGGGSTQIVFEPTFKDSPDGGMPQELAEGDHKYVLDFGGRIFALYQHSYLGYGLNEARNQIHAHLLTDLHEKNKESGKKDWLKKPITHPCIAPGMTKEIKVELPDKHPLGPSVQVNMTGPSDGTPALCRGLAEKILEKEAACALEPCSFRGIHQPSFDQTFAREDVYLLSYFFDRIQPLGMPESFSLAELRDLATRVCHGEDAWDVFAGLDDALAELRDRPEHCLDLSFELALLHTGYGMPIDREVRIAKQIKGNELGWALGASLPLLSQKSGWQCKVTEVHN